MIIKYKKEFITEVEEKKKRGQCQSCEEMKKKLKESKIRRFANAEARKNQ